MTFAQLFTTPLGTIGESLSEFFAGTMLHVPMFVWPMVILLIMFLVIFLVLMCSRYEVHLPFMMGSLRPSAHVSVATTKNDAEHSTKSIHELENKLKELQSQLDEKHRSIEYNKTSSDRVSRSTSVENLDHQRGRSLSSRQTPIGFKKEYLSD